VKRESLIAILKEIAEFLTRNGHSGQAEYVSALATITQWDQTAVGPGLTSGAMWGGSGSVWEVGFDSREEHRTYWRLLVRLVEEMRQAGITSPGAEFAATAMANWLKSGI
jgi:hypothetical protein